MVFGSHTGQFIDLNVDYRLQHAMNISDTTLFGNDGNFKLDLESDSLTQSEVHFLIASPWGLPGPPPAGLDIIGEAYEITAANNVTGFTKPALLRFRYDAEAGAVFENLAIYRWDYNAGAWQSLGGEIDSEQQQVFTTTTNLGLYALLGSRTASQASAHLNSTGVCGSLSPGGDERVYLPIIVK